MQDIMIWKVKEKLILSDKDFSNAVILRTVYITNKLFGIFNNVLDHYILTENQQNWTGTDPCHPTTGLYFLF